MGSYCSEGLAFINDLGRRVSAATGGIRETAYLFQRLSVAVQHFNSVLFRCSFEVLDCDY
jgi:hypothetical protein